MKIMDELISPEVAEFCRALWEEVGGEEILPPELAVDASGADFSTVGELLEGDFLSRLLSHASDGIPALFAPVGTIAGVIILSSLWQRYREHLRDPGSGRVFSMLCTAVLTLTCFTVLSETVSAVAGFSALVHTAVTSASTAITALYLLRGMTASAAVSSCGTALFLTAAETAVSGILLPFVRLLMGCSVLGSFGETKALRGLSSLLRKNFLFAAGALMTLVTAVLSFQSTLAQSADSTALRAAKFTLSGAVPVIGGAVGDAAAAMTAGIALTQKSAGFLGIAVILWQLLPPLVSVFGTKLLFSVGAVLAEFLSLDLEGEILHEAESLAGFLCAVLACEGVFYLLMLSLCMRGGM